MGFGMISGGPYHVGAIWGVTEPADHLFNRSIANMTLNADAGLIDSPSNLLGKPSFVMITTLDDAVTTNQQHAQNLTEAYLGTNLLSVELPVGHVIPRLGDGDTNYDTVGNILRHLLYNIPGTGISELNPPNEEPDNPSV